MSSKKMPGSYYPQVFYTVLAGYLWGLLFIIQVIVVVFSRFNFYSLVRALSLKYHSVCCPFR